MWRRGQSLEVTTLEERRKAEANNEPRHRTKLIEES
jgi:hypothetical protein